MSKPNKAVVKVWIFCLLFLPLTIHLGFWQLDRADEKSIFLNALEAKKSQDLSVWQGDTPVEDNLFIPFEVVGHYQPEIFLLDNRISNGVVGYEVLSVFQLFTGEKILVNRGWIKAEKYREFLPEIASPRQLVTLAGHFYRPEGEVPILKQVPFSVDWPKRIQQVEWARINQALGDKKLSALAEFRLVSDDQVGAYKTGWPETNMLPEKHLGYAYQWFALSAVLIILSSIATVKILSTSPSRVA